MGSVLVIAATDSSGGAGLARDIETLAAFRTTVRCAVTAVTVQTDRALQSVHPVPASLVSAQIRAALQSGDVAAIKIGVLGSAAVVQAVADTLPARDQVPVVLDPVLAASAGGALLDAAGRQCLLTLLLPRVTLLTPNLPEAAALLGEACATDQRERQVQLRRLLALGPAAVLLKGGHDSEGDRVVDTLALAGGETLAFSVPRVAARRRGTGCSLASAIAAQLAAGETLARACSEAQAYVAGTLRVAAGTRP